MSTLTRFGMSLDRKLLAAFDRLILQKGYANRSEAIRDLIRSAIVEREWSQAEGVKVGVITLIYELYQLDLPESLTAIQHDYQDIILSTTQHYLDTDHCLMTIAVRGETRTITRLDDTLQSLKGVVHGQLVMTTTAKDLK